MSNIEQWHCRIAAVAKTGKVDFNQLLVLRTASNFPLPQSEGCSLELKCALSAGGIHFDSVDVASVAVLP